MSDGSRFDAIIIGSGISGLSCASLFARLYHKKVLVLERHFRAGGFTHSFRRKGGYEWDVGIHYVGEMNPGSHYRALFDQICAGGVDWRPMPEVFDRFVYPDFTFDVRSGIRRFREDLINRFPAERRAIEQYFKDLIAAARWYGRLMLTRLLPRALHSLSVLLTGVGTRLGMMTTGNYLDRYFRDEKLKAILLSQWGNTGLPPGKSAFAVHAVIACHYFDGGFYPVGGARSIAESIIPCIEFADGKLLTRHRVRRILLDGRRAVGVEAISRVNGKDRISRYYADCIISSVGAYITYEQLIPAEVALSFRDELRNFPEGTFHVCAYLGFKESPAKLGFRGENCWIYNGYDHDALFSVRDGVSEAKINSCFLSFPSLKDPEAAAHTAELITFVDRASFMKWSNRRWGHRGEDYTQIKHKIGKALLDFVDLRFPGFAELVDYCEVSTPLSTASFTGHRDGCIYGLPGVPEKLAAGWLGTRTPLKNLYLTGSDTAGHGVVGALMGGILTTLVASRNPLRVIKLLMAAQRRVRHPEKRDVLAEMKC
ncbi:MAG: phytoene desaturase family protein [Methylococcales bacterium]